MENKVSIQNRKAGYEYHFVERFVAGVVLQGTEVKGIREGLVSFVDSFCYFSKGELWLKGINIGNTKHSKTYQHDPLRERKLLLSSKELKKLEFRLVDNLTIIPIAVFTNERGKIKIEIALARGKKTYDKKDSIKQRDIEKQTKRELNQ
jgi:SsrA-binding protein